MKCLVYLPHSYTGRGPAEGCIRIIESFAAEGIDPTVFVHRARASFPARIAVLEAGRICNNFSSSKPSEDL